MNIIKNNSNQNDKVVNYTCFCKKFFLSTEKIFYIIPCCHIIHEKCFNNYILKKQYNYLCKNNKINKNIINCPMCNEQINYIINENELKKNKKYYQYYIDVKSIKLNTSTAINYFNLPLSLVKFTTVINKLLVTNTDNEFIECIEYILKILNIKINIIDNTKKNPFIIKNNKITWSNSTDIKSKIIIIANHSHYLDMFVLYYLFRCGFISGDFINKSDIGKLFASKIKLLIFKRGANNNTVEKITEYLEEMKRIVIFPEGAMGNNETLLRFRTGAFYTGANICPVVLKYKNIPYDDNLDQSILKMITQNEIMIDVYINDLFHPPFNDNKIEEVRNFMAKVGKLKKSRVSNKTIIE